MVKLITFIIFTHFIADGAMQPERYAEYKNVVLRFMLTHCLIYAGVLSIMLDYLGAWTIAKSIYLFAGHFLIDFSLGFNSDRKKVGIIGYVDQGLHLLHLGGLLWIKF